jgi:hypothetical protein
MKINVKINKGTTINKDIKIIKNMSELLDYCILKDTFVLNNINDFIYLNN